MRTTAIASFVLASAMLLGACNDTPVGITNRPVKMRIVNSTYQTTDVSNTGSTAQPRAIDFRFNQSTATPSVAGIPPNSIYPVQTETPGNNYFEFTQGLYELSAHLAPPATPNTSLYGNTAFPPGERRVRMYLTGDTYYTLIVAGVAPTTGVPPSDAFLFQPFSGEFPLLDDNAPPRRGADGNYQTRIRIVNAAPFSLTGGTTGAATVFGYLTNTATPPTLADLATLIPSVRADYRLQQASSMPKYANLDPGTYTLTVTQGTGAARVILSQQQVTFSSGEVRTILVQNNAYANPGSAANYVVRVFVDAKYE